MKFSLTRIDDALLVTTRGDITENAEEELNELLEKIEVKKVVFDTAKVDLINSLGIRYWINFVQTLRRRHVAVTYLKCSSAVVECCNIHASFALPGEVESFFVPMRCKSCAKSTAILHETENIKDDCLLPTKKCPSCDAVVEPEVDLETYLVFLTA